MANVNNAQLVAKQIKAFNKAWSRADSAHQLTMEANEIINDLVGTDRMTKGGYAKAGEKYLQSLSDYDLAALSSDIQKAREALDIAKITSNMNLENVIIDDPKSAIWSMYNELLDRGYQLDSNQVKSLADGDYDANTVDVLKEMNKVLTKKNYGIADFSEYFDSLTPLE
jgi:hypothetical protein